MERSLQELVWRRAGGVCEYCLLPSMHHPVPFQVDHVIAQQHGGETIESNLALACLRCNTHKGPNIAGIDPVTRKIVPLFHPRTQRWDQHFHWDGPILTGVTPSARATIFVLDINHAVRVTLRATLIDEGLFPPRR
jgi:hypothetical protein